MAKVNITEAAKLAGIGRQHLYRKYLRPKDKDGHMLPPLLSVESDHTGSTVIDTAEILRVFGALHGDMGDTVAHDSSTRGETRQKNEFSSAIATEATRLREQLVSANRELIDLRGKVYELQEDKAWLRSKVDDLTDALKLIEHRQQDVPAGPPEPRIEPTPPPAPEPILAPAIPEPSLVARITATPPPRRGWLARLLGR